MRGISSLLTLALCLLCSALLANESFYSPLGVGAGIADSNDSNTSTSRIEGAWSADQLQNLTPYSQAFRSKSEASPSTSHFDPTLLIYTHDTRRFQRHHLPFL